MRSRVFSFFLVLFSSMGWAHAQAPGTIRGSVILLERNMPLHHVKVLIVQLGRSVETDEDGAFEFQQVPAGQYDLVANSPGLSSDLQSIELEPGGSATVEFRISLSPVKQEITVTAAGVEQTAFESFQAVRTLDSFSLAEKGATALGEVLDAQPGVAKRSFGPGTSRPVIRGFDGDRVLVLQDGIRTGSLASQSGDHGEPIDVLNLERLEVVKGPATLLYGSNAVGGVVNAVSGHHQMKEQSQEGFRGYLNAGTGSNNRYGGGGTGFEFGHRNWLFWGSTSNQRTDSYRSREGRVENSGSRLTSGTGGIGWYGDNAYLAGSYQYDDGIYGVPLEAGADPTKLDFFRRNTRLSGGYKNVSNVIDRIRFDLNYSGWNHKELEILPGGPEVGTVFNNKQYSYQAMLDQKTRGRLSGTIGFQGFHRDYKTAGEEAIAPPVLQNAVSVFGLEQLKFERFELQLGGRLESTSFEPEVGRNRRFTGLSGAAGVHLDLWNGGAFVVNYTHSYRSPALEELYNNGPHPGNLTFEIGNANLRRERSDGLDFSLRHINDRVRAEANTYIYRIDDFVYLAPTGREREDLTEARYSQGHTRYAGTELSLDYRVVPVLWIATGIDYVSAELRDSKTPLPRIPPLRGRFGFDVRWKGLSVKPELVAARAQNRIFETESRTAGYAVVNLTASYTLPAQHFSHHFSVNVFNVGDTLYRNHVSFIKELAPEIGRGVKATYSLKFF